MTDTTPADQTTPAPSMPQEQHRPTLQEATRQNDGRFQTTADWMRHGGKQPDVYVR